MHPAESDVTAEYVVRQDDDTAWWLSLHQCPTCFALVVEDFMPEHHPGLAVARAYLGESA